MRLRSFQWCSRALLIGMSVANLCGAVRGQEARPVQLRAVTNQYSPFLVADRWSLQAATVINRSPEPRTLQVLLSTESPTGQEVLFARVATIPAGFQRRVSFAYRPETLRVMRRRKSARGEVLTAELPMGLIDDRTGQRLTQMTGQVQFLPAGGGYAGLAIEPLEHNSYSYLNEALHRLGPQARVLTSRFAELPEQWYGYDSLAMMLLSGTQPKNLTEAQLDALLRWVRSGGVLVLTSRAELPALLDGPLGQAAGVCGLGVHQTDELAITNRQGDSVRVRLTWPVPFTELCAIDAEVLHRANGLPLLTSRRLGQGTVMTLAVPVGAVEKAGPVHLWSAVVDRVDAQAPLEPERFPEPGWQTLQQIAGRRAPTAIVPLAVLLGLCGGTLLLGGALRCVRRGEWLWVVLLPGALATSGVLWRVQEARQDPPRLTHLGLATAGGDGLLDVREQFIYYTGPDTRELSLGDRDPDGLLRDLGASGMAPGGKRLLWTDAEGMRTARRELIQGSTTGVELRTVRPGPGLGLSLSFDARGLAGAVRNDLPGDLQDAVLYSHGVSYRLGSLPAGAETTVRAAPQDRLGPGEFSGGVLPNRRRDSLVEQLIPPPGFGVTVLSEPLLVGYLSKSFTDPLPGQDPQRQGWTVVVWPVSYERPPAGTTVSIPAGMVATEFVSLGTPVWNAQQRKFLQTIRPTELLVWAWPPEAVGVMRDITARLDIALQASSYRLVVYGVKEYRDSERSVPPGGRVKLAEYGGPTGRVSLDIPRAGRFVDDAGRVRLLLAIEAGSTQRKRSLLQAATTWTFERIEVGLKGTVK